jgi:predicted nucleic acid-binding protein
VRELWASDAPLATSWITLAETSAAIAAAECSRRLSRVATRAAVRTLEREWPAVTALTADGDVARRAAVLAIRHRLRGMDAIHLASAIPLLPARPVVVTFDRELARAARAEGLPVAGLA